jgi:dTDP-4-amino-4,6-dideoxygalactose transaminase
MATIKFSQPFLGGLEHKYLGESLESAVWHGDGEFSDRATQWLRQQTGSPGVLLTTSCTHALEMANMLLDIGPGDEVISPSFTFPSAATAIATRGGTPVFVDIQPDTLNVDVSAVEAAITERTKAVCLVHYAGVAADLDNLMPILEARGIALIEDNAHGLDATWRGQHLGTFGDFGTHSWHDTKNVTSGEGGALLIKDPEHMRRAEILREKGTNRSQFLRGEVDKYTWVDHGSSFLPSDILCALLMAQFERFDMIQERRHRVWNRYHSELRPWATTTGVQLMTVPDGAGHAAHLYYLVMPSPEDQSGLIGHLAQHDIISAFHYQPLDTSPAGRHLGRTPYPCHVTASIAARLVRLPLHASMSDVDTSRVIEAVMSYRVSG